MSGCLEKKKKKNTKKKQEKKEKGKKELKFFQFRFILLSREVQTRRCRTRLFRGAGEVSLFFFSLFGAEEPSPQSIPTRQAPVVFRALSPPRSHW